jgi:hypothetical protein
MSRRLGLLAAAVPLAMLAPVRAVVVLIGANDYGLVARRAC